jgi:hypothetical protein
VTDQINVTPDVHVEVSMSRANLILFLDFFKKEQNTKKVELENKCLTDLFLDFFKKNKIQKNQDFTWFPVLICCVFMSVCFAFVRIVRRVILANFWPRLCAGFHTVVMWITRPSLDGIFSAAFV